MALYGVSFAIREGEDSGPFFEEIGRLGGIEAIPGFVLINISMDDPGEVRNHLAQYLDAADQIMIVPVTGRPAHRNASNGTNPWIDLHT